MYPKQKSYIPRFALLIHFFDSFFDNNIYLNEITSESILKAEKLSNYFINVAKKIKIESTEVLELKTQLNNNKSKTTREKIIDFYKKDNDFNRSKVAELLGVSIKTVQKYIKEIEI